MLKSDFYVSLAIKIA